MYKSIINLKLGTASCVEKNGTIIPLNNQNLFYQQMIHNVATLGADVAFPNGDIPDQVAADAVVYVDIDALEKYSTAMTRLAKRIVTVEIPADIKVVTVGYNWNQDTQQSEPVEQEIPVPAIPAETDEELIAKDLAERAQAQAVIDVTPDAVKTAYAKVKTPD